LRLTPAAKRMLHAAAAAEASVSEFVLDSALRHAEETLADRRFFGLDAERWKPSCGARCPARSLPRLERLFAEPACSRKAIPPHDRARIEKLARRHPVETSIADTAINRFLLRSRYQPARQCSQPTSGWPMPRLSVLHLVVSEVPMPMRRSG